MDLDRLKNVEEGGVAVLRANCFDVFPAMQPGSVDLVIADPPYVEILDEAWDQEGSSYDKLSVALVTLLKPGGTAYVWGGVGTFRNRVFFKWLSEVERVYDLVLHNLITWSKKRAYGKADNYLFTREECAMLVKPMDSKQLWQKREKVRVKPKTFNIPLLEEKRGYAGYNPKYPAKSEYKRRTNVWTDITEIFQGKINAAQKPEKLAEIMIRVSSNSGDLILDPFAGSGSTGVAARNVGNRRTILIEKSSCEMLPGLSERLLGMGE